MRASLLALLAESVLMLLFGVHSVLHQGSDAVAFSFSNSRASASTTRSFVVPANRSDPLKTPPTKRQCGRGDQGKGNLRLKPVWKGVQDRPGSRSSPRCPFLCCSCPQPHLCSQCDKGINVSDGCECDLTCKGCDFRSPLSPTFATTSDAAPTMQSAH